MKRSLGAKMGEISSLIYLIFPYYGLYLTWQDDSFLLNLFIVIIFTFAYASLILFHEALSHRINLMLFFIHFLAIIYFVYAYNPTLSLFFFFSAFAIPFLFKRSKINRVYVINKLNDYMYHHNDYTNESLLCREYYYLLYCYFSNIIW